MGKKTWQKKPATAPADFPCANAGCPATGQDTVNQRCAGCGAVWYCGRRCRKYHWDACGGNHKGHCKPAPPKPEEAQQTSPAPTPAAR